MQMKELQLKTDTSKTLMYAQDAAYRVEIFKKHYVSVQREISVSCCLVINSHRGGLQVKEVWAEQWAALSDAIVCHLPLDVLVRRHFSSVNKFALLVAFWRICCLVERT